MKHDVPTTQPSIPTKRFLLRPVRASDHAALEQCAGDSRVARMTRSIPHPLPRGATEAFIERANDPERSEDVWIIDGSSAGFGPVLGAIGLERMDRGQAEIAYWVAPGQWGSGIATEAVRAILEANPLDCQTIFAAVFQDNPVSARVLTNCGFDYLGDAECYSVARRATVPTWTYSRRMAPGGIHHHCQRRQARRPPLPVADSGARRCRRPRCRPG